MKLNEIITDLGDGNVSQLTVNALKQLIEFIDYESYCPGCKRVAPCRMRQCTFAARVSNLDDFERIKRARKLLNKEYYEETNEMEH